MAADKALVDGAYRASMANATKDTTKISMMEGASITKSLVGGITMQAKKAAAARTVDKDLKTAMGNLAYAGIGDKKFMAAGKSYFSNLNWNNLSAMEKEKAKADTKMMGVEGKDFGTTVNNFIQNPDMFKTLESSGGDGVGRDGTKERFVDNFNKDDGYELSYGDSNQLMIKFKGSDEAVPWKQWKSEHIKENTDKDDAVFMSGLRKDIYKNASLGQEFEFGSATQKITENLLSEDIDINHFSRKKAFKMSDGKMGTFKDVLMNNPEAQNAILKSLQENPNLTSLADVDGIPGVSTSDMQMLIANEQSEKYTNSMSELVDAITNPKNPLYNTEFAQDALSSTIALDLQQSSHSQGNNKYNQGTAQVINRQVDEAFRTDPNLLTAENYSENGAFDLGKLSRIKPGYTVDLVEVDGKKEYQISKRISIDGVASNQVIKKMPLEPTAGQTFQEYQQTLIEKFKLELGSKNTQL